MTAEVYSNNVSFTYEHADAPALIDITLSIPNGQCVVLCGASGCGKTTYSRIVNGLIPQFFHGGFDGEQHTCGFDTAAESIDRLTPVVGSVFQNPKTQYFNAKVIDELAFPAENMGLESQDINHRIAETAQRFNIEPLLDRSIFHLSGGQKQRIALAAATMLHPKLLVLDEPTSNLDAVAIRGMRELIAQLKTAGMTIIIAEHRLAWLNGIADRYIIFDNGRIAHEYAASEFLELSPGCIAAMGLRTLDLQPYRQRIAALESQTNESVVTASDMDGDSESASAQHNLAQQSSSKSAPLLSTRHLNIGYRGRDGFSRTIPDIDLYPGQIIGLMGHNGCGKTTLVRTLTGLIKPVSGTVLLNGKPAKPRDLTHAGFLVMQDVNYQLFSDSVREELLLGLDETDPAIIKRCNQVLEDLDLTRFADRHPMSLSGGQKQRVAIGSALMCGKDLIILDEPTSGLDRYHMEQVGELLRQLAAQGKTVLVVTHDEELAAGWCTSIINLEHNGSTSKPKS
ncbi:energy-coupling factor ABC transporter ATP-binding protein [Bifidobacterium imperatoris]|uniref:ABC transporter ATP-binding protein n=1 Tax=Bifidobacterium imperatoris TaxID=2020965 RepID=A0A2N5IRR7_9BIFI|nr:energy-coupling factor ABC transporter ATP-binding protein [Bifidobacterium imperatoris]PLS24651.1 ABC transporter ATP-binding protein [Bifidobacterium imperatoris]QSY57443.1 energy-coupling factor ABC transporter ATP-binding protein [Bifidobacterium imperatoris]